MADGVHVNAAVKTLLKLNRNSRAKGFSHMIPGVSSPCRKRLFADARGFSLIEISVVLLLAMIFMAISIPIIQDTLAGYRLRSAVASATWAIQATRYQAIMKGYPYQLAFNATNNTYQVANQPPGATSFSNTGSSIPLSGSAITLSQATTLQFKPNGFVQATAGQMNFSITHRGNMKTITISSYGNVTVTP